jgi:hypothetical protein
MSQRPDPHADEPPPTRMISPYRETSHHAMPYCAMHNRLYPHAYVGWLTPAGISGLHLLPMTCDECYASLRQLAPRSA